MENVKRENHGDIKMSKTNSVNKKVVCSLLIALLATSLVLATLMFDDSTLLANAKTVLDVEIKGLSKLGVNEPGQYIATVNGVADSTGSYVWTISPDDGKTTLTSTGYGCTVTFIEATLEPYLLSVSVSKAGAVGFDVFTLYDPVTLPDYHLAVASNPYNYMIAADGLGWYYVVNGTSGQVVTSGTNSTALEISTYAYGDGAVVLNQIAHNSSATVPANVTVIELYQDDVEYFGSTYTFNGAVYATSFNSTTFYVGATNVTGYMLGSWLGGWNTTVAELIGNAAITWGQITGANATIQELVGIYESTDWLGAWNATVTDIIGDTAISWSQITNADVTVNNLITSASLNWSQITNGNTTVQQIIDAYTSMAWKSGWNATVEDIVTILFTTQSWNTDWNTTVNSLIAGASLSWSQITNANTTVQQIVDAYSAMAWKSGWNATVAQIANTNLGTLTSLIVSGTASFGNATLTSGVFPSATDYIIYKEGSTYYAKHANGTIVSSSASGTTVINAVEDTGVSIGILGTIEGQAIITHSNAKLTGIGSGATLKLPDGTDDNVVNVTGSGVINVQVSNLIIDGNKANNAAGAGLYCKTDYVSTDTSHVFQNLRIIATSGDGLKLVYDARSCMLNNIYIGGNPTDAPEGKAFNIGGTDHDIVNCVTGFAEKSGFYVTTTNTKFTNCKSFAAGSDNDSGDNAQWTIVGPDAGCYNSFTNCHAQDGKYKGWILYNGARDNIFTNCQSDDNGQTSDSSAWQITTNCVRNTFIGCYVFNYAADHMTMGFTLDAGCDYNQFIGNNLWNGQNDGFYINGGDYNYFQGNTINSFAGECFNIVSGTGNRIGENFYLDVGTGVITDAGTATVMPQISSFPMSGTELAAVGEYAGRYIDTAGDYAYFGFAVPSNAQEIVKIECIVVSNNTQTHRLNFYSEFGATTEDSDTHTDSMIDVDLVLAADYIGSYDITNCFTGLTGGDYATLRIQGDASTSELLAVEIVVRYV